MKQQPSTAPRHGSAFVKVTLPFLAPTIAITVMLRTIWIATFADLIYVMT
jgi:multiple sugar transport system permease protein